MNSTIDLPVIIYGAGGHGLVVAEAALSGGLKVKGFLDDDREPGSSIEGRVVLDWNDIPQPGKALFHIAVGDNTTRQRIAAQILAKGYQLVTIIHPSAQVNRLATVMPGAYIGANAAVNPRAMIGEGAIVNTGAIVEHHASVDAFAHIAPGAVLTGRVFVGECTMVGANAVVNPGLRIGCSAQVGSGAVVTKDVADGQTVMGVPAR